MAKRIASEAEEVSSEFTLERSRSFAVLQRPLSSLPGIAVAVVGTGVAILIRWMLWPVLGNSIPYMTFFPVVMAAAYLSGFRAGILASVLGAIAVDLLLIEPRGFLEVGGLEDVVGIGMFIGVGAFVSLLSEWLHGARRTAYVNAARMLDSEARYRTAIESISDAFMQVDESLRFTFVNAGAATLYGRAPDSLPGKSINEVDPHFAGSERETRLLAALACRQADRFEYHVAAANGRSQRWYEVRVSPCNSGLAIICSDVTDRKEAEAALQAADQRKDEFIAILSHELRNPLAPIRNAVQIMKMVGIADPRLAIAQDVIARQVATMARLLDDLLDVSRITANRFELRQQHIDIHAVIESALETSRPLVETAGVALSVEIADVSIEINGDSVRLSQVISNVINNAAKYTDRGGHIWITVSRTDGQCVVTIRDDGIGIPAEILPHVFDIFTQDLGSRTRSQGGLGIGLALVRGIVERHGGTIAARSEGRGKGSEFVIRLPIFAGSVAGSEAA